MKKINFLRFLVILIASLSALPMFAENAPDVTLSDFLTADMKMKNVSDIFRNLQGKGFSISRDSDEDIADLTRDDISISYYLEEMEGNADSFNIQFPSEEAAQKFISSIMKDKRWKPQTNYFGNVVSLTYNKVTIDIIGIPMIGISSKRK